MQTNGDPDGRKSQPGQSMKESDHDRQRGTVQKGSRKSTEPPFGDVKSLMHELGVHQEELKAQNEELRQKELELSRARDRYKELFDLAPIGYVIVDGDFLIREANLTAAALCGVNRNDLIGTPLSKFMTREEADAYYLMMTEVRKSGTPMSRELAFHRPDGSLFHGYLKASPHSDSLLGNGWRIALVDITPLKQAEMELRDSKDALRQANEHLEQTGQGPYGRSAESHGATRAEPPRASQACRRAGHGGGAGTQADRRDSA